MYCLTRNVIKSIVAVSNLRPVSLFCSNLSLVSMHNISDIKMLKFNICIGMEQHTLRNVNNGFITNIYSYLETSGCQSSNLYLNAVHFFNTNVN
jgi:hypothetical protein